MAASRRGGNVRVWVVLLLAMTAAVGGCYWWFRGRLADDARVRVSRSGYVVTMDLALRVLARGNPDSDVDLALVEMSGDIVLRFDHGEMAEKFGKLTVDVVTPKSDSVSVLGVRFSRTTDMGPIGINSEEVSGSELAEGRATTRVIRVGSLQPVRRKTDRRITLRVISEHLGVVAQYDFEIPDSFERTIRAASIRPGTQGK